MTDARAEPGAAADVVARLRDPEFRGALQHLRAWTEHDAMQHAAAAEIERLRAEVARMREALKQIAGSDGLGLLSMRDVAKETLSGEARDG